MADVQPFQALHYDLARTGGLQPVAAPPYDVIDAAQREELVRRSPYNVVEVDLPRNGIFARVKVEDYGPGRIRPHERTHPGPKEDRLRLTRATRANLSPIFSLYDDPAGAAWNALEPFTGGDPWGVVTDDEGTLNRLWLVDDPGTIARVRMACN